MLNESKYFLQSSRLGFRTWNENDLPLALILWGDEKVTRYIDSRKSLNDDQVRDRLWREIETEKSHNIQYWPIFLLEKNEFVGCCGLRPYDDSRGIFEIGAHIVRKFWRRGIATGAAKTVIEYAFNVLKVNALFAGHNPENKASRNFLQKLGFKYTHDEYYKPTGLNHPSYLFSAEDYI